MVHRFLDEEFYALSGMGNSGGTVKPLNTFREIHKPFAKFM